jgi:hypothetical protein
MFIAALFTIAKLWKQPRCPTTDEWIKKMWYLYPVEFYLGRTSFYIKLASFRRPEATCSLSYVEYRPNTNITVL